MFKQKKEYEMRNSEWSSDVCSSDLRARGDDPCQRHRQRPRAEVHPDRQPGHAALAARAGTQERQDHLGLLLQGRRGADAARTARHLGGAGVAAESWVMGRRVVRRRQETTRSEEHTSELPSLMRISYAVFCLKKQKK